MTFKRIMPVTLMLAAVGVIGTSAAPAHAASVTCTVTRVNWYSGSGGTVQILCNGAYYYGFSNTSGSCAGAGVNATKVWASLAQSALLSGKSLYLVYSGTSCLNNVGLNSN